MGGHTRAAHHRTCTLSLLFLPFCSPALFARPKMLTFFSSWPLISHLWRSNELSSFLFVRGLIYYQFSHQSSDFHLADRDSDCGQYWTRYFASLARGGWQIQISDIMFHLPSPETCQVWIWKQEKVKWMFTFSWFIVQQINIHSFPNNLLLGPRCCNELELVRWYPLPIQDTVPGILTSDQWETRGLVSPVVSGQARLWLVGGLVSSTHDVHTWHQTILFSLRQDEVGQWHSSECHSL